MGTVAIESLRTVNFPGGKMVFARCALSASYATGGDTLTPGSLGFASFDDAALDQVMVLGVAGSAADQAAYDVYANATPETDGTIKIKATRNRANLLSSPTGIQLSNASDASSYKFNIVAIGR